MYAARQQLLAARLSCTLRLAAGTKRSYPHSSAVTKASEKWLSPRTLTQGTSEGARPCLPLSSCFRRHFSSTDERRPLAEIIQEQKEGRKRGQGKGRVETNVAASEYLFDDDEGDADNRSKSISSSLDEISGSDEDGSLQTRGSSSSSSSSSESDEPRSRVHDDAAFLDDLGSGRRSDAREYSRDPVEEMLAQQRRDDGEAQSYYLGQEEEDEDGDYLSDEEDYDSEDELMEEDFSLEDWQRLHEGIEGLPGADTGLFGQDVVTEYERLRQEVAEEQEWMKSKESEDQTGGKPVEEEEDELLSQDPSVILGEHLRAKESPGLHTMEHVVKTYMIKDEDLEKYFPEGLAGEVDKEYQMQRSRPVLIREHTVKVIEKLRAFAKLKDLPKEKRMEARKNFPTAIVLTGERGCGKSMSLNHIVHFARESGWIVFFVPRARDYTHSGAYVVPHTSANYQNLSQKRKLLPFLGLDGVEDKKSSGSPQKGSKAKSQSRQDVVDDLLDEEVEAMPDPEHIVMHNSTAAFSVRRPNAAQLSLENFYKAHKTQLEEIPCTYSYNDIYEHPKGDQKAPFSLADLVAVGASNPIAADWVMSNLRKELQNVTKTPVLIVADQIDQWYKDTSFKFGGQPIRARKIIPVRALARFRDTDRFPMTMFVGAETRRFTHDPAPKAFRPKILKTKVEEVVVPPYSNEEFDSIVKCYRRTQLMDTEALLRKRDYEHLRVMTANRPSEVFVNCSRL